MEENEENLDIDDEELIDRKLLILNQDDEEYARGKFINDVLEDE